MKLVKLSLQKKKDNNGGPLATIIWEPPENMFQLLNTCTSFQIKYFKFKFKFDPAAWLW